MEPHKRPVPAAYAAAAELYKQKKFPQAAKAFEAIIQSGVANVDTHLSLAYCYLLQRLYSKAVKEFEWVAKYGKNSMTLQRQCGQTASSLRTYMAGVCPAPCLKANDPRWFLKPDGKHWISVSYSRKATWIFSENHIGEYVANENGIPVLKGTCPVCGGTGRVKILKDGDPAPRI
jgi:tetratricopeptide (TPR) repeat protein